MKGSTNNAGTHLLSRRRSFRRWLKRVTIPRVSSNNDKMPQGGVFNIPLTMSIKYAQTTVGYVDNEGVKHSKAGAVPIIVAKCGSYLKKNGLHVEGIFRVSGNQKRINTLEFLFDQSQSNYGLDLSWDGYTVHDAASVLRRYLNKLPEPVIPLPYYQRFRDVMNDRMHESIEGRIEAFQKLIRELPIAHQHLLLYLLDTLSLFASFAEETKMTITNLASVFCPAILRHPDHNTPLEYKISQYVIEFLIEFQSLFTMQQLLSLSEPGSCVEEQKTKKSLEKGKAFFFNGKDRQLDDDPIPPVPLLIPSTSAKHDKATKAKPQEPVHLVSSAVTNNNPVDNPPVLVQSPTELGENNNSLAIKSIQNQKTQPLLLLTNNYIRAAAGALQSIRHSLCKITLNTRDKALSKVELLTIRHYANTAYSSLMPNLFLYSVLSAVSFVVVYELYLAIVTVRILEPLIFFSGLICYWSILYNGIFDNTATTVTTPPTAVDAATSPDVENINKQQNNTLCTCIISQQGEKKDQDAVTVPTGYTDEADNDEALLLQDEAVRSEWHGLLTRAWKAEYSTNSSGFDNQSVISVVPDMDNASVISRCSRFNEEEEPFIKGTGMVDTDDEADEEDETMEDLAFDAEALERYLDVYNQIKNDAQMAKQLQREEERARDKHNPFLAETEDNDASTHSQGININDEARVEFLADEQENDDPHLAITPTGTAKEEWKIKIFSR